MKYSMKAHSINYERGNEYTWPNEWNITEVQRVDYEKHNESTQNSWWNIQWKNAALIMKNVMKAPKIPNEIFNERMQQ